MARIAFSIWNERIAPVFDVARHFWIIELADGRITGQTGRRFSTDDPDERALRLASMGVEQVVCGAISRHGCQALTEKGLKVVSFVAGELEQVVQACLCGSLDNGELAMPGCGRTGARRTRRGGCRRLERGNSEKGGIENA